MDPLQFVSTARVAIVAGKGGVGKTPVTAVLARAAIRRGLRVLVIELDGSQHASAEAADARRTAFLAAQGWTVIRFWNGRVLADMDNLLREIIAHLPAE